ncbi:hypothetical protein FPV67DRAFT_56573 [Lyophyllum atratum]|nr:hypothetical protein FPV67DRAFT_56573 [Lyophyllum atratum]
MPPTSSCASWTVVALPRTQIVWLKPFPFSLASFLSILFHHRKVSRTIAAQAAIHNPVATVVCWVDVVLAKLSALILTVASGFSPHPLPPYSKFIQSQREEDDVRAATQLPEKWQSIVDVIASNKRSPAAMRLATRLIFAAYVMGPQLNAHEDWIDPDVQPEVVMAAILRNAKHRPMNGFSSISSTLRHDMEERANHAMIVSIYSASQGAKGRCQASKPLSPMRIHGLSYLLTILQLALHGNVGSCGQTVLLYEDLNLAQVILVRWGNLVPWSCATWHDQRIANVECIADLTITWLYHLNSPFCADSTFHCLPEFTVQLESTLTNHSYFGGIILQVLHRLMIEAQEAHTLQGPENISFDLAVVLQKSCAAVIQFLRINVETRHPRFEDVVQPICRSLLALFCSLGDKKGDLNDLIIEALTLFDTATLRSSFQALRKDPHTQLDAKLNEDIARSSRLTFFTFVPKLPS